MPRSISTPKKSRQRKAAKPANGSPKVDYEKQRFGVFIECEDDAIAPVLLRQCPNKFEACGWREQWKVDDLIQVKMTIRPIDANGKPTAEERGCDHVESL
jgi:hypothetical protein